MINLKSPYRVYESIEMQVYKMPYSNCHYAIFFINNKWRMQECYIENETIYLRATYPFLDFDSLTDALKCIEDNNKIDIQNKGFK